MPSVGIRIVSKKQNTEDSRLKAELPRKKETVKLEFSTELTKSRGNHKLSGDSAESRLVKTPMEEETESRYRVCNCSVGVHKANLRKKRK